MEITPVTAPRGLALPEPVEGAKRPAAVESDSSVIALAAHSPSLTAEDEELSELAARAGLELRLHRLPDSSVTLIRMVEPETGEIVREFPPEGLATVLAELRARAAARLDRKA